MPWMQQSTLSHDSSSTNNLFKNGIVSTKLSLWYFKKKKKTSRKKKKASKMGEKGLQRIYQMKDLNPECTRIPKKQPNLKISNISKFKEDREISNKDL